MTDQARLERNLRLLDAFYVAQNGLFWLPVFVLWFGRGLSPGDVFLLEAVYYAAVVVLEVPSGWMSDRLGRRGTLVLSGLGWGAGAALIATGAGVGVLACGQVLLAAGRAFASGTDSSAVYETLVALGRGHEARERLARAGFLGFLSLGASSLGGGLVGALDLRLPYVLSAGAGLAAAGLALALVEPPRVGEEATPREQLAVVRTATRDPVLVRVFGLAVLGVLLIHIPYELQQPWLAQVLAPEWTAGLSGVLMAASYGMGALGSRAAPGIAEALHVDGVPGRAMSVAFALLGLVMAVLALGPHVWLAPAFALRSLPTGMMAPLVEAEVHPRLPSSIRATWLSLQSLAGRLVFAVALVALAPLVGDTWTAGSLRTILASFAVVAGVGAVWALRPVRTPSPMV